MARYLKNWVGKCPPCPLSSAAAPEIWLKKWALLYTTPSLQGEATNSGSGNSEDISIEDLQKEIETLKKKIIEEREKLKDKTVVQVSEGIEAVHGLNVKVRRSLKGHNAKVLCLDWSIDKRHLVSSSQVTMICV